MGWYSTPFGKENPEPMGHGMGLYAFRQGESRAYGQWDGTLRLLARRIPSLRAMGLDSTPFGEKNPEHTGNGMGLYAFWLEESLVYVFYSSLRVYGEGPRSTKLP
jgi:hypothetical protein